MSRPRSKPLIDRKGKHGCHRGQISDSFDFDTERGQLCPMWRRCTLRSLHRYSALRRPSSRSRGRRWRCAAPMWTINVFRIEIVE